MSKKDKIKSMIDFYKAVIIAFMTALFGILGYTFIHYKEFLIQDTIIVVVCAIAVLLILSIFVGLFLKEINRLEKEE